jgi:hypothetical protein
MVNKMFDGLDYTREALAEELSLVERHARDGSAVLGGCSCIEEKHLLLIAGLASEGVTLATDQAEKEYYMNLAELARAKRLEILDGKFRVETSSHSLEKCERKIDACVAKGKSEEECRVTIHCK